jgi:hypothetical protein
VWRGGDLLVFGGLGVSECLLLQIDAVMIGLCLSLMRVAEPRRATSIELPNYCSL